MNNETATPTALVLDTETTDLVKAFAYDVGYQIVNRNGDILCAKSFVIEQVWHNLPLFESAYYKDKRPLYVLAMRRHESIMTKWGYMVSEMIRDMRKHNVAAVYAFNAPFDDRVFSWNCDWFKTRNPLDTVPVFDIWGYSSQFITNNADYRTFCELHELFNDSGNYSGNAESVYKFIMGNPDFVEAHQGLDDVKIETQILLECIKRGAEWDTEYKVNKILNRVTKTPYKIKVNGAVLHEGEYIKKYVRNGLYSFTEEEGE